MRRTIGGWRRSACGLRSRSRIRPIGPCSSTWQSAGGSSPRQGGATTDRTMVKPADLGGRKHDQASVMAATTRACLYFFDVAAEVGGNILDKYESRGAQRRARSRTERLPRETLELGQRTRRATPAARERWDQARQRRAGRRTMLRRSTSPTDRQPGQKTRSQG